MGCWQAVHPIIQVFEIDASLYKKGTNRCSYQLDVGTRWLCRLRSHGCVFCFFE